MLGLCCAGVCLLAMPLLAILAPAISAGLSHGGWIMRLLMGLSLAVFALGIAGGYLRHRRWAPAALAMVGIGGVIAAEGVQMLPRWFLAIAAAFLLGAWFLDRRHLKEAGHDGACR